MADSNYRSLRDRYGPDFDKRRPRAPVEPPPDPFKPPVTNCPRCGDVLKISAPGYKEVPGLRVAGCPPCNLKAALVERIIPVFRQGDAPDILETLTRDMEDSERQSRAMFGDDDAGWQGL